MVIGILRKGIFIRIGLLSFLFAGHLYIGNISFSSQQDQPDFSVLRVAFTRGMFSDMHPNDAKAAIKVWADSAAKSRDIDTTAEAKVYEDLVDLQEAVNNSAIELAALRIDEYLTLILNDTPEALFVGSLDGRAAQSALLVSRTSISTLNALQNTRVNILNHASTGMSRIWLDTLLLEQGLPESELLFSDIKEVTKTSQAVLPVFFGQRDACLVTKQGFDSMVELNPQIGKELRILKISPGIIPGILFLRPGFNPPFKQDLLQALDELHLNTKGQQVLMLFRMDRLIRCREDHLLEAKEMLERYRRLKRGVSERGQDPLRSVNDHGGK